MEPKPLRMDRLQGMKPTNTPYSACPSEVLTRAFRIVRYSIIKERADSKPLPCGKGGRGI